MSITFKVEEIRESSASLAIKLAEALNNVSLLIDESEKYYDLTRLEREKLQNLEELYARVLERDKILSEGGELPKPKKRMDPVMTFDATALSKQILISKNRVATYTEKSHSSKSRAEAEKTRSKLLQLEVKKAVEREKKSVK